MRPMAIIALSTILSTGTILLTQQCGCLHKQDVKEPVKDTATVAACIANHWGEEWAVLMANCAGSAIDLFFDLVAERELKNENAPQTVASTAASAAPPMASAATSATPPQTAILAATSVKRTSYANQPPIASRLAALRAKK